MQRFSFAELKHNPMVVIVAVYAVAPPSPSLWVHA